LNPFASWSVCLWSLCHTICPVAFLLLREFQRKLSCQHHGYDRFLIRVSSLVDSIFIKKKFYHVLQTMWDSNHKCMPDVWSEKLLNICVAQFFQ
jgi:hypothetical protein